MIDGELGEEEYNECEDENAGYNPGSAAKWLLKYCNSVRVIDAVRKLHVAFENENFDTVSSIKSCI